MHKALFILSHELVYPSFIKIYKELKKNERKTYKELKNYQEKLLRSIVNFAYHNVPYYHNLFKTHKLHPASIQKIEDLEKIPILTKDIIKENWNDFTPINLNKLKYYNRATGGSTGEPLKYRISKEDRFLGWALQYRGWGYAGYELGDKMVFFGGASLNIQHNKSVKKNIENWLRNIKRLSSFDMDFKSFYEYLNIINSFKPKYIYGYASSLYFFSKWISENIDFKIHTPEGIFTTAEKLYPKMRRMIEDVFNTEVFDGYGLNDGGVSAHECKEHTGMHIDMERSIMEIVDKDGKQIQNGEGKILATSLFNFAMPFIRYDTGDIGVITNEKCPCSRPFPLLKEVKGREQEILITPEGKFIHGEFFTHVFWEIQGVKEFQVVQDKIEKIVIKIVPEDDFDEKSLDKIKTYIHMRSPSWNVEFKIVDKIDRTSGGKYRFVINHVVRR